MLYKLFWSFGIVQTRTLTKIIAMPIKELSIQFNRQYQLQQLIFRACKLVGGVCCYYTKEIFEAMHNNRPIQ